MSTHLTRVLAILASTTTAPTPPTPALAAAVLAQAADPTLSGVIGRARNVVVGLLVALATLQLTIAGVRYLFAAGEPEQLDKAKRGVRAAAIGYGLAALAPGLVALLQQIVGV
jgi:Type IV secretion system pilin